MNERTREARGSARLAGHRARSPGLALAALALVLAAPDFTGARADPAELEVFHPPRPQHHTRNAPPVVDADLRFRDEDRKPYGECWYYLAVADDGTLFFCHFNLMRVNFLLKQYSLDFSLYLPDGTRHFFADGFEKGEMEAATDRFQVRLGPNRVGGTLEKQQVHIEELGYTLDLTFTPRIPALRDGSGRIFLDPKKKDYLDITYQPDLEVTGTLRHEGRTVPFSGWGYSDHVRQTFIPTDFAKVLYAFRAKVGDVFLTALEYHPEPGFTPRRVPSLIVTWRDRLLMVSHAYSLEATETYRDEKRSKEVPQSFRLEDRTDGFELECTAQGELLKRVDLLASVSPFQKKVLDLIGIRSFSYIFEEATRCTVKAPEVSGTFEGTGILEVLVSD